MSGMYQVCSPSRSQAHVWDVPGMFPIQESAHVRDVPGMFPGVSSCLGGTRYGHTMDSHYANANVASQCQEHQNRANVTYRGMRKQKLSLFSSKTQSKKEIWSEVYSIISN